MGKEENSKRIGEFFSLSDWKRADLNPREFFREHEDYVRIIAACVAIAGLLLNIESDDIDLKRLQVFFMLLAFMLLAWVLGKWLLRILRGPHKEIYFAIAIIPYFIVGALFRTVIRFLYHKFSPELLFYWRVIVFASTGLILNLAFIGVFRFIGGSKRIHGGQLENFFLLIMSWHVGWAYFLNGYDISETFASLFDPTFNNLFVLYLFFATILSELRPRKAPTRREFFIDLVVWGLLFSAPHIVHYALPRLFELFL